MAGTRRSVAFSSAAAFAFAVAVAAGMLVAPLAATAQEPAEGESPKESDAPDVEPRSPGIDLPEGEGKALVQTGCMPCHDLAGIAAFKGYWNRQQWAAMVATMIGHGAQLDAAEAEIVTDYLAAHFGVEERHRQERGSE